MSSQSPFYIQVIPPCSIHIVMMMMMMMMMMMTMLMMMLMMMRMMMKLRSGPEGRPTRAPLVVQASPPL